MLEHILFIARETRPKPVLAGWSSKAGPAPPWLLRLVDDLYFARIASEAEHMLHSGRWLAGVTAALTQHGAREGFSYDGVRNRYMAALLARLVETIPGLPAQFHRQAVRYYYAAFAGHANPSPPEEQSWAVQGVMLWLRHADAAPAVLSETLAIYEPLRRGHQRRMLLDAITGHDDD